MQQETLSENKKISTNNQQIRQLLKTVFGYTTFRGNQEEIIKTLLNKQDSLVLMPTGGGKSMCFQIPALLFPGITVVISPLISLMKDQVDSLKLYGIDAEFFNSTQPIEEQRDIIAKAKNGKIKILYISPETAVNTINQWLSELNVSFIAIDEAHCVSTWGHDFRPHYKQLKNLRNYFPNAVLAAFTATAEFATLSDIETHLGLKNPQKFVSSFDRPNIHISMRGAIPKKIKINEIEDFIKKKGNDTSGIIYCLSRKNTEEMASELKSRGIHAGFYHAGMENKDREFIQNQFISDNLQVVCATTAFGMGIDKSNVRWVIHSNLPKNIEGYYQEIGRAGRDSMPAEAILYFNYSDVYTLTDLIENSAGFPETQLNKLERIVQLAEASNCRRSILLAYFGEYTSQKCGNCDNCEKTITLKDATIPSQMALSGIIRTREQLTVTNLVDLLKGKDSMELVKDNFHKIPTFGKGKDYTYNQWAHYILQLKNAGFIRTEYSEKLHLKVTQLGHSFLKNKEKIAIPELIEKKVQREKTTNRDDVQVQFLTPNDLLFNKLKLLRKSISIAENKPAYLIFSDATLTEMSIHQPRSEAKMKEISGVGTMKMDLFGKLFLNEIEQFIQSR